MYFYGGTTGVLCCSSSVVSPAGKAIKKSDYVHGGTFSSSCLNHPRPPSRVLIVLKNSASWNLSLPLPRLRLSENVFRVLYSLVLSYRSRNTKGLEVKDTAFGGMQKRPPRNCGLPCNLAVLRSADSLHTISSTSFMCPRWFCLFVMVSIVETINLQRGRRGGTTALQTS